MNAVAERMSLLFTRLPLARLYASYFGGGSGLELVSLYRFGTDVFIKLRALDMKGGDEVMI